MEMELSKITGTYIKLLQDTLDRKLLVIRELLELSQQQNNCLKQERFEEERFDELMDKKSVFLEELSKLDAGFDRTYELIRNEVSDLKELYCNEITTLQEMIRKITDVSVNIQAVETRNRDTLVVLLGRKRMEIRNYKTQNRVTTNYYKTMANQHGAQSYFYDKKK